MPKRPVAFSCSIMVFLCMSLLLLKNMRAESPKNPIEFNRLVDDYFDFYFQFHPKEATAAGFHQYDAKLEDYSPASREGEISNLRNFASQLERIDPAKLPPESAGDLAFLQSQINGRLLELQVLQMWRKDPNLYVGGVTENIFLIIKRNFAPPEERLRSVIAREQQIPGVFMTAHSNLKNPPKIYTQIAIQQLPGIIGFFQKDVPGAFQGVTDAALRAQFQLANAAVVKALENFQHFLEEDLLPASQGDFRIGEENFRKKLLDDEMVKIPLDKLLEIGYSDMHRNQERLKETAALINPNASPREVLALLEKDHPAPDQLLPTFRNLLGSLREFIAAGLVEPMTTDQPWRAA